jgi:hypothetical protein
MISDSIRAVGRRMLVTLGKTRRRRVFVLLALTLCAAPVLVFGVVLVLWTVPIFGGPSLLAPKVKSTRGLTYFHDVVRKVPWSMHVVKINRSRQDLELHSMMGKGTFLGMATVSDQVKMLPPEWGHPVAAVNGDLYNDHPDYPGDPDGLQIVHGELVSAPSTNRVCFWMDPAGNPHRGQVVSQFEVTWPDGRATPLGLNEARASDAAVLYTAAVGVSTRTRGGLELVLERQGEGPWLPLQIGQTYTARVREVNQTGNTSLTRELLVLSLDPDLLVRLPHLRPGAVLKISTASTPDLAGTQTAIGGSPTLVEDGKAKAWPGLRLRHPRTAVGWNEEYLFLVEVDGRQLGLSAGMTLSELADYMVKLGCQEAINLDGGGSATCWLYGNVMNNPSQGRERPAANGLVMLQKEKRQK